MNNVLGSSLQRQIEQRGTGHRQPARYKVMMPLPTADEYAALRRKRFTLTVGDLVSSAYGEVDALADELQSWYDGMGKPATIRKR